jgi:tRNA(fMet)-specific endonuclease VapC
MKKIERAALDSSAVILFFRGQPAAVELFASLQEIYLPLTVLGELYLGLERSQNKPRRTRELNELLAQANLLLPNLQTAQHYARIKSQLLAAGTPIPDNDIWIAALARQSNLPLAARDEHFEFIEGLEIISL